MGSGKRGTRWRELPARRRAAIGAAGTVQVALLAAALLDLQRRPAERVNGPKRLWYAASFVNFVGPIAYFAVGRKR
ncbi:hypothetical protein [Actinomadura parmotrematis]|uniref:Cardiolipin synthase N-terminal domain-containing protein n=1 Tax=Actinomadura parmotrematis TaxID=2864039 RepID=A0ABS7FP78_9ACTN|nr:hypothetical protein [Actinomadura parmotrematis]MBW8482188.1 hypothetical protein [Actinomadura parmotrematis]